MYPAISRESMIKIDNIMINELQIDLQMMMEHAGNNLAKLSLKYLKIPSIKSVLVIIGSGNNGGGGLVASRILKAWGLNVECFLAKGVPQTEIIHKQFIRAKNFGVQFLNKENLLKIDFDKTLVLDAFIGYNFKGEIRPEDNYLYEIFKKSTLICLDVPSAIDANTGKAQVELKPLATVTLAWPKKGLILTDKSFIGELYLADIGIPSFIFEKKSVNPDNLINKEMLLEIYSNFMKNSLIKCSVINHEYWSLNSNK